MPIYTVDIGAFDGNGDLLGLATDVPVQGIGSEVWATRYPVLEIHRSGVLAQLRVKVFEIWVPLGRGPKDGIGTFVKPEDTLTVVSRKLLTLNP